MKTLFTFCLLNLAFISLYAQKENATPSSVGLHYGSFLILGEHSENFKDAEQYGIGANFCLAKHFMLNPYFNYAYTYFDYTYAGTGYGVYAWSDNYIYSFGLSPKFYISTANNKLLFSIGPTIAYNQVNAEIGVSVLSVYTPIDDMDETHNENRLTLGAQTMMEWRIIPHFGLAAKIYYDNLNMSSVFNETYHQTDINIKTALLGFSAGLRYYW